MGTGITGLTIGTGPFRELADSAARTFKSTTGLPCAVIGDAEYDELKPKFPHHLKYHIFDLVEADTVVYFDADLWWLREWDPKRIIEVSDGQLVAVRDLTKTRHIVGDARMFDLDVDRYFNSGLLVMHRDPHKWLLSAARGIYDTVISSRKYVGTSKFKDQTSLNFAVQMMDVPVHYIDRRYNWVQSAGEWVHNGMPVIGAHKVARDPIPADKKKSRPENFGAVILRDFQDFLDTAPVPAAVVQEDLFKELSGLYSYERVGLGEPRPVQLRTDGTVAGGGLLEQWWFPVESEGTRAIWVAGHTRVAWKEYLTFTVTERGAGEWVGKWNHFEEMPVRLNRL